MATQEGKSSKMKFWPLCRVKGWRIRNLFKIRKNNVTKLAVENTEPSPQEDNLISEPTFASLSPFFNYHPEDSVSLDGQTKRELQEHFIYCQGIVLTAAAKELTDEEWCLLYEDVFKPLDFNSILNQRSKSLPSGTCDKFW